MYQRAGSRSRPDQLDSNQINKENVPPCNMNTFSTSDSCINNNDFDNNADVDMRDHAGNSNRNQASSLQFDASKFREVIASRLFQPHVMANAQDNCKLLFDGLTAAAVGDKLIGVPSNAGLNKILPTLLKCTVLSLIQKVLPFFIKR